MGRKKKVTFTRPEGAGNFDNMDDFNFCSSINTQQGTVDHIPTQPKDIANKEYVDANAGSVGGIDTEVQFNNSGVLDGNSTLTFNDSTNTLTAETIEFGDNSGVLKSQAINIGVEVQTTGIGVGNPWLNGMNLFSFDEDDYMFINSGDAIIVNIGEVGVLSIENDNIGFSVKVDMGNNKIENLATPTVYDDAVRKDYVDNKTWEVSDILDFDTEVTNNVSVVANTAKISFDWDYDYVDLINKPTTITTIQSTAITNNTAKVSFPEAPTDGKQYARKDSAWDEVAAGESMPIGSVITHTGSFTSAVWKLCDGQAISRTTYSVLYADIGTTYGVGDGSTTFNLPDMSGLFPRGKVTSVGETGGSDNAINVSHNHTAGNQSASHIHGGETSEIEHTHTASSKSTGNHRHGQSSGYQASGGGKAEETGADSGTIYSDYAGSHSHTITVDATAHKHSFLSGNQSVSHNHTISTDGVSGTDKNIPAYLGLNFLIKVI